MTELEIKEYLKKFAEETGKSVENLEVVKKEDLIDGVIYYGVSPIKEKDKYLTHYDKYIRQGEYYYDDGDIFDWWDGSNWEKLSYEEFLPIRDISVRENLEKLRNLWETGKINYIYLEPEDGDDNKYSFTYYPEFDITMKCDNIFEGHFYDSMIEVNPELSKGRIEFDIIVRDMGLTNEPAFVEELVSRFTKKTK